MTACKCGREIGAFPHCVMCGSTNVYARAASNLSITHEGEIRTSRGFRCRRCGTDFHELQNCEAPTALPKSVSVREAAKVNRDKILASSGFDPMEILQAAREALTKKDPADIKPADLELPQK